MQSACADPPPPKKKKIQQQNSRIAGGTNCYKAGCCFRVVKILDTFFPSLVELKEAVERQLREFNADDPYWRVSDGPGAFEPLPLIQPFLQSIRSALCSLSSQCAFRRRDVKYDGVLIMGIVYRVKTKSCRTATPEALTSRCRWSNSRTRCRYCRSRGQCHCCRRRSLTPTLFCCAVKRTVQARKTRKPTFCCYFLGRRRSRS